MHIVATDVLTCPRCGPEFGLIVLADRMEGRRVAEGRLGCANCREEYPVRAGAADLRTGDPAAVQTSGGDQDRALRFAALLGVGGGAGPVLMLGAEPDLVGRVGDLLPNAMVLGASTDLPDGAGIGPDWVLHSRRLPFRSGSLRGVALAAAPDPWLLQEALRVAAPGARVVVEPASPALADRLVAEGLELLLFQDGVAVASNPPPR